MIFVDTGYLLALLNQNDELNVRAIRWAKVITQPLVTTEYVLWEVVNSLSQPADRAKAYAAVHDIRTFDGWVLVAASSELFEAALSLHHQRKDKSWSLTDCASFITMDHRGLRQALTYDHHFEQAGFEALLRRDPS